MTSSSTDPRSIQLRIPLPNSSQRLSGILTIPPDTIGLVAFVHGSGSSHLSPRNTYVARCLQQAGLATALFDLFSHEEDVQEQRGAMRRFDIAHLRQRLILALDWIQSNHREEVGGLPVGLFGASTGGAAAIEVGALREDVHAVVSRGGRPDLADPNLLQRITAPVLLLVGGEDHEVIRLNRRAFALMTSCRDKELVIIPGATHLFEEPGTLEQVAAKATDWFKRWLGEHSRTQRAGTGKEEAKHEAEQPRQSANA